MSAAHRSINEALDTQQTRPTNELEVPPPKGQHSIDYDQQDDAKMSDQQFTEIYFTNLRKKRKIREANVPNLKCHSLEGLANLEEFAKENEKQSAVIPSTSKEKSIKVW